MTGPRIRESARRALPFLLLASVIAILWIGRNGASGAKPEVYRAEAVVMGGVLKARLILVPDAAMTVTPAEAAESVFAAIREIDLLLNPVHATSDVRRLNEAATQEPGTMISVRPLTWQAIMESLRFHRLSDGAFDITVAPLLDLYSFRNGPVTAFPLPDAIRKAKTRVGSEHLLWEREGMRIGFAVPGMKLTFGGIAQGFALDQGREALRKAGVKNAVLEVGGEVWVLGHVPAEANAAGDAETRDSPAGQDPRRSGSDVETTAEGGARGARRWSVGIRDPRGAGILKTISCSGDSAISTSGDYEKFFEVEGKRYSHILDPRTGFPTQSGVISATVVSPRSCVEADALATAVSVLGPAEGEALLRLFPGVEAHLVIEEDDGTTRVLRIEVPSDAVPTRP